MPLASSTGPSHRTWRACNAIALAPAGSASRGLGGARFWVAALLILGALSLRASPARAQCVDEELKEQLIGRRAYRGVVPRLFKKALRHELSAFGGWYAADLSDGKPTYGGAYTFHFTEDLGLEASYARTNREFGFLDAVNARQQNLTQIARNNSVPVQLFMGHLLWSLAYGKVRWFGGPIGRFDFYLALGAGAVDEAGTSSVTGSGGFGMKFYLTQWMLLRLDIRDHVHSLRAPLGVDEVVNDVTTLGGLSVMLPFSS